VYLSQVSTLLNRHAQKFWLSLREALILTGAKWTFGSVVIELLPSSPWPSDFFLIMPGFGSLFHLNTALG
jgi:hypothetical protein